MRKRELVAEEQKSFAPYSHSLSSSLADWNSPEFGGWEKENVAQENQELLEHHPDGDQSLPMFAE